MSSESHKLLKPVQQVNWRTLYETHLEQSLQRMGDFARASGMEEVSPHLISMMTLLEESVLFPSLMDLRLELIQLVHPLPLRLGLSHRWEPRILEIIECSSDSPAFKMRI